MPPKKQAAKRQSKVEPPSDSESLDSQKSYEVEFVHGERTVTKFIATSMQRGVTKYLVRWRNFSSEYDTWEPLEMFNTYLPIFLYTGRWPEGSEKEKEEYEREIANEKKASGSAKKRARPHDVQDDDDEISHHYEKENHNETRTKSAFNDLGGGWDGLGSEEPTTSKSDSRKRLSRSSVAAAKVAAEVCLRALEGVCDFEPVPHPPPPAIESPRKRMSYSRTESVPTTIPTKYRDLETWDDAIEKITITFDEHPSGKDVPAGLDDVTEKSKFLLVDIYWKDAGSLKTRFIL
ncbi:hypothetical protein HDU67_005004 [Dinochytrium kinnereticum]|nr:hypothetical protein HDU67_005004 [Dinochytrium kinnereticum]